MPYHEHETQAWQYYDIAKAKLEEGYKSEALLNFNMAYNIAQKIICMVLCLKLISIEKN